MTEGDKVLLAADLYFDAPVLADGTMWSHAATLGTRYKNGFFTIDKPTIENIIRVFRTGFPQKVCVDYEHSSENADAQNSGQPIPAAGQVKEFKGVYSAQDFTGELKAAAQKIAAKVGRPLDDPKNFGLWMRWKPTARALQMVTQREYTDLSIVLYANFPDNETGEGQGPTVTSVALVNAPFLDDMLPVAASRDNNGGNGADPPNRTTSMPVPQMLQRAAALFGRAFTNEDEVVSAAEERITSLSRDNTAMKPKATFADAVVAELGESDPVKAVTSIKALKATADTARREKEDSTKKANESQRDAILLKHEKRLTPAQKDYFGVQLMAELSAGKKPGETATEKVIESLPENKALGRKSAADGGKDAPTDRDARIALRANELLESNPVFKKMAEKDDYAAYKRALRMASSEIPRDDIDKK
jgi:phage I-like protein